MDPQSPNAHLHRSGGDQRLSLLAGALVVMNRPGVALLYFGIATPKSASPSIPQSVTGSERRPSE